MIVSIDQLGTSYPIVRVLHNAISRNSGSGWSWIGSFSGSLSGSVDGQVFCNDVLVDVQSPPICSATRQWGENEKHFQLVLHQTASSFLYSGM